MERLSNTEGEMKKKALPINMEIYLHAIKKYVFIF